MTTSTRTYEPAELVPPGETLIDWLEREDMTQADFAKRTSLTPKHINQVVKGTAGISAEVALAFERVTEVPARYWLQLEANYQTAQERVTEAQKLAADVGLVDLFPYNELLKRGCVRAATTKVDKLRELLRFFRVADGPALRTVSLEPSMFRLSVAFTPDHGALAAWLRIAELQAAEIETATYDANALREALPKMRALSLLPGTNWVQPLIDLAASVGVALVIVKELPKCRVNGATRWLSQDKAMVALSLRHKRNDGFWFTLFHELCHVLRHSKKQTIVDSQPGESTAAAELEEEADIFARRTLIPPQMASELPTLKSAAQVQEFAKRAGIAPGIVVGRMHYDKLIPYSQWNELIGRYKWVED